MLPLHRYQSNAYRFGRGLPPGLEGKAPRWIAVNFALAAQATQRDNLDIPPFFHLLAVLGSSSQAAGFRAQLFDINDQQKMQARGVNSVLGFSSAAVPLFLRYAHPYGSDSAVLVIVQNLALALNNVQIVLFGVCDDAISAPDPINGNLPEYGASKSDGTRRPIDQQFVTPLAAPWVRGGVS